MCPTAMQAHTPALAGLQVDVLVCRAPWVLAFNPDLRSRGVVASLLELGMEIGQVSLGTRLRGSTSLREGEGWAASSGGSKVSRSCREVPHARADAWQRCARGCACAYVHVCVCVAVWALVPSPGCSG